MVDPPSVSQHAICAHKPASKYKFRKRGFLAFEELAYVALGDSLAPGDREGREIAIGDVCLDVVLDGAQPSHTYATTLGGCGCIVRCAERYGDEVAKLRDDELSQLSG